jgi:tRNA(fMet)-specific endonuclease VapC
MSLYVLDTDILTLYRRGHPVVFQRVNSHPGQDLAITVMSVEEQLSGWYTLLRQSRKRDQIAHAYDRLIDSVQFHSRWRILPYPVSAMSRYDSLKKMKIRIGKTDSQIAAIALENGGTLVTRNLRDFQQIPGLPLENWAV